VCGVSECDCKAATMRRPRLTRAVEPLEEKSYSTLRLLHSECIAYSHTDRYTFYYHQVQYP
jgi:hypothetical protein